MSTERESPERKEESPQVTERNKTDANVYVDRAIAMLKDLNKNQWLVAGYNGVVSLLEYAKDSHTASISQPPGVEAAKEAERRYPGKTKKAGTHGILVKAQREAFIAGSKYSGQGWISVEDRLPELRKPYYDDDWGGMVTPLYGKAIVFDGEDVFEGDYDKDGFKIKEVTHWMPLPSPPITRTSETGKEKGEL